jgi:hypothetical protein
VLRAAHLGQPDIVTAAYAVSVRALVAVLATLNELLPEFACIEPAGTPSALLSIAEYLDAGRCLPEVKTAPVREGLKFLAELKEGPADALPILPLVGTRQPTFTTAQVTDSSVRACEEIGGADEAGDGTVPRLAATPHLMDTGNPAIHWTAEKHGALQHNRSVLDQLEGVLAAYPSHRGPGMAELRVRIDELATVGAALSLQAEVPGESAMPLEARVLDEKDQLVLTAPLQAADGHQQGEIPALPPGTYQVVVGGRRAASGRVAPVTSLVAVLDPTVT